MTKDWSSGNSYRETLIRKIKEASVSHLPEKRKTLIDQALEARLALADEQVAKLGEKERATLAKSLRKLAQAMYL